MESKGTVAIKGQVVSPTWGEGGMIDSIAIFMNDLSVEVFLQVPLPYSMVTIEDCVRLFNTWNARLFV